MFHATLCFTQRSLYHGCGAAVKMTLLRFQSTFFMNMAPIPAPELLVFMSVALAQELSFLDSMAAASASAPAPASFLYTLIFSLVWVCLKLNGNEVYRVHETKRIYQTYLSRLTDSFFTISAFTMRKPTKNSDHRFRRFRQVLLAET